LSNELIFELNKVGDGKVSEHLLSVLAPEVEVLLFVSEYPREYWVILELGIYVNLIGIFKSHCQSSTSVLREIVNEDYRWIDAVEVHLLGLQYSIGENCDQADEHQTKKEADDMEYRKAIE
jgi:hypothetical protein